MSKRYQVFVSSTYIDLYEERSEAIQALLELDCMPAGMELFPASNEQQWSWIKRIIDESDYYLVIVAGRYGSVHLEKQISYTEMEYRHALDIGKPTLAFLHKDPGCLPQCNCEETLEGRERLFAFRQLCEKKLCKYWEGPADLAAKISRSLTQLMKHEPRAGWVRADSINDSHKLELMKLREENRLLKEKITSLSLAENHELAGDDDLFVIKFLVEVKSSRINKSGGKYWVNADDVWSSIELTWDQIFYSIIPALATSKREANVIECLNRIIGSVVDESNLGLCEGHKIERIRISGQCINQIRMQLLALDLIKMVQEEWHMLWNPTEKGNAKIFDLSALRKGESQARTLTDLMVI